MNEVWITRDKAFGAPYRIWRYKPWLKVNGDWTDGARSVRTDKAIFEAVFKVSLKPGERRRIKVTMEVCDE